MSDPLAKMETPISRVLDRLFQDSNLAADITYRLYRGQDGTGEDLFDDYSLVVIPTRTMHRNTNTPSRVPVRSGDRRYLIRDADLPGGVTVDDLSTNDRIIHGAGSQELAVLEIDKSLGFVVEVTVRGE